MVEGLNKYTVEDKEYMTSVIPVTTNKFAPSGSSKNKNITFAHARAVMTKINRENFFDLKSMFVNGDKGGAFSIFESTTSLLIYLRFL